MITFYYRIKVSTELEMTSDVQQNCEKVHQILQVRETSDTKKMQASYWPK